MAAVCALCQQAAGVVVDPRLGQTCEACTALVRCPATTGSPVPAGRALAARLLAAAGRYLARGER